MLVFSPTLASTIYMVTVKLQKKNYVISFLQVCERSLSGSGAGPNSAAAAQFVRAEMLPSGYLVRPCDGGGSIIHIVDHMNLEVLLFKPLPFLGFPWSAEF